MPEAGSVLPPYPLRQPVFLLPLLAAEPQQIGRDRCSTGVLGDSGRVCYGSSVLSVTFEQENEVPASRERDGGILDDVPVRQVLQAGPHGHAERFFPDADATLVEEPLLV